MTMNHKEPRPKLCARKTGLSRLFITDRSNVVLLLWFILNVIVRPLSDWL